MFTSEVHRSKTYLIKGESSRERERERAKFIAKPAAKANNQMKPAPHRQEKIRASTERRGTEIITSQTDESNSAAKSCAGRQKLDLRIRTAEITATETNQPWRRE